MKHSKAFITVLSIFVLAGCNTNKESVGSISSTSDSNSDSAKQETIDIGNQYKPSTGSISNRNYAYEFKLPEFGDDLFEVKSAGSGQSGYHLTYKGKEIIDDVTSWFVFASDINNDGYREIVSRGSNKLAIYDVHNNTELFNKDINNEPIPGLYNPTYKYLVYAYSLTIHKSQIALVYGNGSASARTFDYAFINYSKENGVTFELQNMYDIDRFNLLSIEDNNGAITASGDKTFALAKNTKYTVKFDVTRKANPDLEKIMTNYASDAEHFQSSGIYIDLNNALAPTNDFVLKAPNTDDYFGTYQMEFNSNRLTEANNTFKIAYCGFSFSFNVTVS